MEKIVKQIQLLTLIIILISTVIAIGSELYQMFKIQTVTLADLLLLFLYLEVLAMVRVFWESQSIQITLPLFIAITALSRFIILQGKSINPEILVYEAGAILLIALAILVLRFRNSPIVGLDKKKKNNMCPVCWISGFIAALLGGSFIAVVNHPISWILSIFLISYAGYKFYEAKKKGKQMNQDTKDRNKKTIFRFVQGVFRFSCYYNCLLWLDL